MPIRAQRRHRQYLKKNPAYPKTVEQVRADIESREEKEFARYRKIYKDIIGQVLPDPEDFHLQIDTSHIPVSTVVNKIFRRCISWEEDGRPPGPLTKGLATAGSSA